MNKSHCMICFKPEGVRCNGTKCEYDHLWYDQIDYDDGSFECCFFNKGDKEKFEKHYFLQQEIKKEQQQ